MHWRTATKDILNTSKVSNLPNDADLSTNKTNRNYEQKIIIFLIVLLAYKDFYTEHRIFCRILENKYLIMLSQRPHMIHMIMDPL